MLESGGQNLKWPTRGPNGYIIRAVWEVSYALERGTKSKVAQKWAQCCITSALWGVPYASERGTKSEVAHKWAQWLHNPYRLGGPLCFRSSDKIRSHKLAEWLHIPCHVGGPLCFRAGHIIRSGPKVPKPTSFFFFDVLILCTKKDFTRF